MTAIPVRKLLTPEGPDENQMRLIGVELAASFAGRPEIELEMFACKHTLPMPSDWQSSIFRVTLHTSAGDVTWYANRGLRPGNYYTA